MIAERANHAAVRDDERVLGARVRERREPLHDALAERRAPFTARELEVGGVLAPGAIEHRVLRLDLLRGEPLPAAEVDLAKLGHEKHGRAIAEQRGALPRTLQRA